MVGNEEVAAMVVRLAMESDSYEKQMQAINREMKVVDSAFKATGYNAKTFGESVDGLEANLNKCNKVLELQSRAVSLYENKLAHAQKELDRNIATHVKLNQEIKDTEQALEEAKDAFGNNSDEVSQLERKLKDLHMSYEKNEQLVKNSQKALDNSTISYNNVVAKMKGYEKQLQETEQALEKFNKETKELESVNAKATQSIGSISVAVGTLVSSGIQMAVDGLKDMANYALEFGAEMNKLSLQTGMTTDELQQWDAVLMQTGSSIREADGDLAMLAERINEASMGTGEGLEVWEQLGITVIDTSGKLKSQGQVLDETVKALQNMEDVTKRNALASQLLGTTGENLMPILNATNEELEAIKGNANIVSDTDIARLNSFKKTLVEFCDGAGKELIGIFADLGALLEPLVGLLGAILKPILGIAGEFTSVLADTFSEVPKEYDKLNSKANEGLKTLEKSTADSFSNMNGTVNEAYDNMKDSTDQAFGDMNKTIEKYMSDFESKVRKDLEGMYGDSITEQLKLDAKVARIMEAENKRVQEAAEVFKRGEEAKIKAWEDRVRKTSQSTVSRSGSSNIPSYDTGTQFHLGGLAYVHKDELVDLPRGSIVHTKSQTQQILKEASQSNNNSSIVIQNVNMQTNDPEQFLAYLKNMQRRG